MIFPVSMAVHLISGWTAVAPTSIAYKVPAHSWVSTTTFYIEGQATHWLQAFRQVHQGLTWEAFCVAITEEFGVDEFELEMH